MEPRPIYIFIGSADFGQHADAAKEALRRCLHEIKGPGDIVTAPEMGLHDWLLEMAPAAGHSLVIARSQARTEEIQRSTRPKMLIAFWNGEDAEAEGALASAYNSGLDVVISEPDGAGGFMQKALIHPLPGGSTS